MAVYIIIQTIVVYLIITVVLYISSRLTTQTRKIRYITFGLIIYSIIFGLRYGVGYDCNTYIESYEALLKGNVDNNYEVGFSSIMSILAYLKASHFFFLFITAFLQIFFVFYALKDYYKTFPYITLTFMLGCIWLTFSNGIRQEIAFSIFIYALFELPKNHYIKYFILIIIASLFHKSALLLLTIFPIYHIFSNKYIPNRYFQILLVLIAVIIGQLSIIQNFLGLISNAMVLFGYDTYMNEEYSNLLINDTLKIGIGFFIQLLLSIIIVYNSRYILKMPKLFQFIYFLYFIGLLYKYIFHASSLLQRINYYFYGLEFIVGGILLFYLISIKKKKTYYQIIAMYSAYFIAILYKMFDNCSAFYFIWEKDLYL